MNPKRIYPILFAAMLLTAGCAATRSPGELSEGQFGHRVEGEDTEGRVTLLIEPADQSQAYQARPAPVDGVQVRPGPSRSGVAVPVEILIKGAFPDGCSALNDVSQSRSGRQIRVTLDMRRPTGSLCAAVMRPYRFYLALEGAFEPGAYTLILNDTEHRFEIQ